MRGVGAVYMNVITIMVRYDYSLPVDVTTCICYYMYGLKQIQKVTVNYLSLNHGIVACSVQRI